MPSHTEAAAAVDLLSESMLELWQERDPFRAAPFGYPAAARLLPQYGESAVERRRHALTSLAAQARAVSEEGLDPQRRLTREILIEQSESAAQLMAADTEVFTVNLPREFSAASVVRGMTKTAVVDEQSGLAYLARLRQLPAFLDTDLGLLDRGVAEGRAPLRRPLEVTLAELDGHLSTELGDDPLLGVLRGEWDGAAAWRDAAERVVAEIVRPALARFTSRVRQAVLPEARGDDRPGLCWIPRGEEAYAAFLREEITLPVDPLRLHEEGLATMAEIGAELSRLGRAVLGESDPAAIVERLRSDLSLAYTSGEDALAAAAASMADVEAALPGFFARELPHCEVAAMPAATAKHYGGGQYMPGAADGSRSGVFYINTTGTRFRHEVRGMVTGGAVPGSHVFWSYAFAADVPAFRRVAFVPAFVKGWASYGGRLALEMGQFSDPLEELGFWAKQAVNAARQVVDTGVHAKGWTRDAALGYLIAHTALSQRDAETELSRLIAMPGEGPIFAFGGRQIAAARAEAEAALGAAFDLGRFHDHLLRDGAMPLATMRARMTEWARSTATA
ncbi:DUF885 domain-containing protein [Microbacterium sp.]|uniref:DUF885 domain-containing protein n=1 Tax=Microbacterium sp. TaxID=51671 RepID=UPI00333FA819